MNRIVRVGCRESRLAVRQAEIVANAVNERHSDIEFRFVAIKTQGDKIQDRSLDKIGGKGLFVKELELALLGGEIDIAVHSYKDMPFEESSDLPVVALSERGSPFDALVLGAEGLDEARPVGSSSLRRSLQFKELYKNAEVAPIRGNVLTRLAKLDGGEYSAIVLAQAGLNRIGLGGRVSRVFTPEEMLPAAAQGILAVQGRAGEDYSWMSEFHSVESDWASRAERQFIRTLEGGCFSPAAAYCEVHGGKLRLRGMYADGDGFMEKGEIFGAVEEAERMGESLALTLKEKAAR